MNLKQNVRVIVLTGDMQKENTLDEPMTTVPHDENLTMTGNSLSAQVKGQSFNVYKISYD